MPKRPAITTTAKKDTTNGGEPMKDTHEPKLDLVRFMQNDLADTQELVKQLPPLRSRAEQFERLEYNDKDGRLEMMAYHAEEFKKAYEAGDIYNAVYNAVCFSDLESVVRSLPDNAAFSVGRKVLLAAKQGGHEGAIARKAASSLLIIRVRHDVRNMITRGLTRNNAYLRAAAKFGISKRTVIRYCKRLAK